MRVAVVHAQMAKGDKERCPKGGWPEYMNGEWYNLQLGRSQGDLMTEAKAGKYGWGPYSDQPCRFTTVEQKLRKKFLLNTQSFFQPRLYPLVS